MSDLNCFSFTGRLTADAKINTTGSGKKVLSVNVAINTGYGDNKKVLFIKMNKWGDNNEGILPFLTKGALITASGTLSREEYTAQSGKSYVDFVVTVGNIILLGNSAKSATKSSDSDCSSYEDAVF